MKLFENLLSTSSQAWMFVKKNAPTILSVVAAGTAVGACASTAIGTWHAKDKIEQHNIDISDLQEDLKAASTEEEIKECKKLITKRYIQTGCEMAELYAVPAILLGTSVASTLISNKISNSRLAALGASYTVLNEAFKKYRKRVEDKLGKEAENDIFFGAKEKEVEIPTKNGKTKKVKVKEYNQDDIIASNPCAVLLGEGIDSNLYGNLFHDINLIQSIEFKYTNYLNSDGYVLFCDIAKDLGIKPKSKAQHDIWHSYGWVKDPTKVENLFAKAKAEGIELTEMDIINANRVDLGLHLPVNRNYMEGTEPMLWIVPNITGNVMEYIFPSKQKQNYEEAMAV